MPACKYRTSRKLTGIQIPALPNSDTYLVISEITFSTWRQENHCSSKQYGKTVSGAHFLLKCTHFTFTPFALKGRLKIFNHICGFFYGYKSLLIAVHTSAKRLTVWSGAVRESHHESAALVCLEGHKGTAYDKLFPTTQSRQFCYSSCEQNVNNTATSITHWHSTWAWPCCLEGPASQGYKFSVSDANPYQKREKTDL